MTRWVPVSSLEISELVPEHKLKFWQIYSKDHPTDVFTYGFRKWFVKNNFRFRLVRWLAWILRRAWVTLPDIEKQHNDSLILLKSTEDIYSVESEFGDDAVTGELTSWMSYQRGALSGKFGGESPKLYEHVIATASDLINDFEISKFFNLGVCYPYIDSELAKKFPETSFIGIERTEILPMLNNHFFKHHQNLESISGDLFEYLSNKNFQNSIFFHARTLTLMSKSFVERVYKSAAKSEFSIIFGNEQVGVSRSTGLPYCFSFTDQPSQIYRKRMFMHNYPAILENCGYQLIHATLLKTEHPDPDYRIFSFIAQKRKQKSSVTLK